MTAATGRARRWLDARGNSQSRMLTFAVRACQPRQQSDVWAAGPATRCAETYELLIAAERVQDMNEPLSAQQGQQATLSKSIKPCAMRVVSCATVWGHAYAYPCGAICICSLYIIVCFDFDLFAMDSIDLITVSSI